MNENILKNIETIKSRYLSEGFIILGVFGSYARGEETEKSDLDILYELTDEFYDKYTGWDAVIRLEEIKEELKNNLGKNIDLSDKNSLGKIGKKYILPETIYV